MRLGRIPTPKARLATVPRLADFLPAEPTTLIADACDYAGAIPEWPMLGNDVYGDCVFASMAHLKRCQSVNATGVARDIDREEVLRWYAQQTGFDPSDPSTDNGAYPLDALKWFVSIGEVVAFAAVDPDNDAHVAAAIQLFGGLYSGWDLPLAWQGDDTWDAGPNLIGAWRPGSWGGHMVNQAGHDRIGNTPTVTWGSVVHVTAAARRIYCSEAYAVVTREWLGGSGRSVQGFDLAGLKARLAEVD